MNTEARFWEAEHKANQTNKGKSNKMSVAFFEILEYDFYEPLFQRRAETC